MERQMKRHFHEELNQLKQKLLKMGSLAEEMIRKAVHALLTRNEKLANQVLELEKEMNRLEIEIDDFGHRLLALDQPVAVDLRLVIMILKINTDLERIGDHAVNIAEQTVNLSHMSLIEKNVRLPEMARATMKMLSDALSAFIDGNSDLARDVLKRDDEIDAYNDDLYRQTSLFMKKNPQLTNEGIDLIMVGHDLERVADLANNIAEDVIYLKQGKEVRHHTEKM
jgi:phosphate transport system protein